MIPDSRLCDSYCHGCTVLLLQKYALNVCAVLFGFWSSCLKVYIHSRFINTQQRTITSFFSWSPFSRVSLLCWYYKKYGFKVCVILFSFIQLIIKFISISPESIHRYEQQPHLTSLMSYHLATAKHRDCIRSQPIIVREIITPIYFACFSHLRQFTTVTNQC